jgi:hypothetical protein
MAQNLWPDVESDTVLTPVAILRQQADLLGQKTKKVVTARVSGGPDDIVSGPSPLRTRPGFAYTLSLVAPALDNYAYDILRVRHGMQIYPVQVSDLVRNKELEAATERKFLAALGEVLGSPEIKNVIQVLLSQSEALQPAPAPKRRI